MGLLKKIVISSRGRVAQLEPGCGNNQQARASDLNTVIDAVNDIIQSTDSSPVPVAINITATATGPQVASGWITSTSAAAVTITLPSASVVATALGLNPPIIGDTFEFVIDNSAGANTVTIAVAVNGILSAAAAANGASQGLLTVPSGVTGQACFELMFSSATAYTFTRVA